MPVVTGAMRYPEDLLEKMRDLGADVDAVDGLKIAREAGSPKAVNVVLLGRLSRYFDFDEEVWMKSLKAVVPEKFLDMNIKAFRLGRNMA